MEKAEALARIRAMPRLPDAGQKYAVDRFRPEDAWGVVRLVYEIYGEDYPIEDAYVPERLVRANQEGRVRTVVARNEAGEVVGQAALYRSAPPNPALYEYGQMILAQPYRATFAAHRMNQYVCGEMVGRDGVEACYGEAVCNHMVTQKFSRSMGFQACALEPGLLPEEAYEREGAVGRVSCLIFTRVDVDRPQPLYVPECWSELARAGLRHFTLDRAEAVSGPELPREGATDMREEHYAFAGVTRCSVAAAGADFPGRVRDALEAAEARGDALVQFYLGLDSPWSGGAARVLLEAGGFCGGVTPCWFPAGKGGDALLAQRFLKPVRLAALKLFSDDAETFCQAVLRDMERAAREHGAPLPAFAEGAA